MTMIPTRRGELRDRHDDQHDNDRSADPVDRRAPGASAARWSVQWCLAMPAWDSVNDVNTPIAYSGIRRSTLRAVDDDEKTRRPKTR